MNEIGHELLTTGDKIKLIWQTIAGNFMLLPLAGIIIALLKIWKKYTIINLQEIREQYRQIVNAGYPFIICANHLTMIDSIILHWAFASIPYYFFHYRHFSWNIPAVENFKTEHLWSFITYFSKCIPVNRKGDKRHHDKIISQTVFLLQGGDKITLFPEGTRSRTGRIDTEQCAYGAGRILEKFGRNCRVLCVYVRADNQKTYSHFPTNNAKFYITMKMIEPKTSSTGNRAHKDLTLQIMETLKDLENTYFLEFKKKPQINGCRG